jgi:predicted glycoside hydrolase/deacetylase ChbG (UPF0249 family)
MKLLWIPCLAFPFLITGQSLSEKLGYTSDTKLLIIHADDLAVSHSENQASFAAIEKGSVNSASVMVPCPWLSEVAEYARSHPNHDLGLHLTLTSEWKHFKWGPVASEDAVPTLIDDHGFFRLDCPAMAEHATAEDVEEELRAQIKQAISLGLEPTHFDSHMGCLFFTKPEFFGIYLKLGREFKVPVMVGGEFIRMLPEASRAHLMPGDVIVDRIITADPEDFKSGFNDYYKNILNTLEAGVNVLLIHTAYDDAEMQGVTVDHPDWGATWRQQDFDFFTSKECADLIKANGIKLITWREVRDKLLREQD